MKKIMSKWLTLASFLLLLACEQELIEEPKSSEKNIMNFIIDGIQGQINEEEKSILLELPYFVDVNNLTPKITVPYKAKVNPASGVERNFTSPVTYTVTAEDGSEQSYRVSVEKMSNSESRIKNFQLKYKQNIYKGVVDANNGEVRISLPYSKVDKDSLFSLIDVSDFATVQPESGALIDFYSSNTFTVTAQDGSKSEYKLLIQNNEKDIKRYTVPASLPFLSNRYYPSTSGYVGDKYYYVLQNYVLSNAGVTNVNPEILVSDYASVSPGSGTAVNLDQDVNYTVTAEDGSEKNYIIRTVKKSILFFNEADNFYKIWDYGQSSYWLFSQGSVSPVSKVDLINEETEEVWECTTSIYDDTDGEFSFYLYIYPPAILPIGKYRINFYLENGEVVETKVKVSVEQR